MPVPPTYMTFFGDGERDHQRFLAEMDERAARHGVPFLETTAEGLIADDGWLDYSHLNAAGAEVFSRWLGEKIAHLSDEPGSLAPSP
jgi:hypothetical protein